MVRLTTPNGVVVEASDGAAPAMLANGCRPLDEPKPKQAPRRRAKKKE